MQLRGRGGETFLMRMVKNDPDGAIKLLQHGANPNLTNARGETALMYAIEHNPQLIEPLIEAGAHKNVFSESGKSPFGLALAHAPEHAHLMRGRPRMLFSGLKMPDREALSTDNADKTFKIALVLARDNIDISTVKLGTVIRDWIEEKIASGVVQRDKKIVIVKPNTKEVLGLRVDMDAAFGEYPQLFEAGKQTGMAALPSNGLEKLANLLHDNWKEVRERALNPNEDDDDVFNPTPISFSNLTDDGEYLDENKLVYYRDVNGVLHLMDRETLKSWIMSIQDRSFARDLFGGEYDRTQILNLRRALGHGHGFNVPVAATNEDERRRVEQQRAENERRHEQQQQEQRTHIQEVIAARETGTTPLAEFARTQNPSEELVRRLNTVLDGGRRTHNKLRNRLRNWSNISDEDKQEVLSGPPDTNIFVILNNFMFTAIDPMFNYGAINILIDLLDLGADPNKLDTNGNTILNYAIRNRIGAAALTLIEYGADVTLPDADGSTPLYYAFITNAPNTVQRIMERVPTLEVPVENPDDYYYAYRAYRRARQEAGL